MEEGLKPLLWGVVLGSSVCPYCNGFPFGQRHYDCKNFPYCNDLNPESFKIPKTRDRIQLFITDYKNGIDLFTIAKKAWGSGNTEKIRERAENCQEKTAIVPGTGVLANFICVKNPDDYMAGVIEKLQKML